VAAAASVLTYDNLPRRSALLREVLPDGIIITSAAREPDQHARASARNGAVIAAAAISGAALLICATIFGAQAYAHRNTLPRGTGLIAGVFCIALFAFVWQLKSVARIHALGRALAQNTVLAARAGRVLVESIGPLGETSLDVPCSMIGEIRVIKRIRLDRCDGQAFSCLEIELANSQRVQTLLGHDLSDLIFVKRALDAACKASADSVQSLTDADFDRRNPR
jgi:hypothetical protein